MTDNKQIVKLKSKTSIPQNDNSCHFQGNSCQKYCKKRYQKYNKKKWSCLNTMRRREIHEKIKRIMAVLICMTITLTGIPVSVNAENSGGKSVQTMETGNELFITLEENTRYRWNVNDSAEKTV